MHGSDHAIDDTCPHEDGPLGVGALAAAASAGPVHAYESHVTSGDCLTERACRVERFEERSTSRGKHNPG